MVRSSVTSSSAAPREGALRFSPRNWVLLLLGVVAIVAGYMALAAGSTITGPLLLVLGYVVLLPLGIIL